LSAGPKIVVLGMMTKMPVPGVVWQTVHYLVGLERLGYETYYVEAHARTPSMFMETEEDDGSGRAAAFIENVCRRFGFEGRWCYQALHDDGACYGLSQGELNRLYGSATLLVNLHGGTQPLPEHTATGSLIYLETDPVQLQAELHSGFQESIDFLDPHCAFFTFAGNYGQPDCGLPVSDRFQFLPTRQPVVLDLWHPTAGVGDSFTTVGNWKQPWRDVTYEGETYSWSKHNEFPMIVELPERVDQRFQVALAGCEGDEKAVLEQHGWEVSDPAESCGDIDSYRHWIRASRAEFTVAKDQNVRLRTGWFSDRSATYLAAARPVVTQDTGFGSSIPAGEGLFGYSTLDEAVAAVEAISSRYEFHSAAATALANEYFDAGRVLTEMLEKVGISPPTARQSRVRAWGASIPADLDLQPVSRRPLELRDATVAAVLQLEARARPRASIVIVTLDNLVCTKLCCESLLANTEIGSYELIVVDNGSSSETRAYLARLESRDSQVRVFLNDENRGFAPAVNQGLSEATGEILVLLNNDTVVPPGWLPRLARHLDDPDLGLVGPVTNRIGNEAEIDVRYQTYGEFVELAEARAAERAGQRSELRTATMFCVAFRRELLESIGVLDERFEVGLLEDDDYSTRAREAGFKVVCAEDVLVHHFGEATFGALVPTGEYNRLLDANKQRYEEKWGAPWEPYERREEPGYAGLVAQVQAVVREAVPKGAAVLVASGGDDELLRVGARRSQHFPQADHRQYAGHYPADDEEALAHLDELKRQGAEFIVFPETASWWLDFYGALRHDLEQGGVVVRREGVCVIYKLGQPRPAERRPEVVGGIAVLGSLRSGTSLVAGLLELLGVNLGPPGQMQEPSGATPTGFREHRNVIQLNEEILSRFGGAWHHPPELQDRWEEDPGLDDLRGRALDLIGALGNRGQWGWKDPRTCLTLPFWQSLVPSLACVVCLRHPLDAARSLAFHASAQRNLAAPLDDALDLWLRYTHDVLRHTEGKARAIVFPDDLVYDWHAELPRLARFVGTVAEPDVEADVATFVDSALWHHRNVDVELDAQRPLAHESFRVYESLRREYGPGPDPGAALAASQDGSAG
jgi:GT2 family glycosyltransferase